MNSLTDYHILFDLYMYIKRLFQLESFVHEKGLLRRDNSSLTASTPSLGRERAPSKNTNNLHRNPISRWAHDKYGATSGIKSNRLILLTLSPNRPPPLSYRKKSKYTCIHLLTM